MKRRELLAQSGALSLAAGLPWWANAADAAAQAATGTPTRGGVLNIAVAPEPTLLTSAFITTMNIGMVSSKVLEGLVSYDLDLKPVPALATSWEQSTDGRTLSFKLRQGVRWHDGTDFSSADVEYTLLEVWKKLHPFGRAAF